MDSLIDESQLETLLHSNEIQSYLKWRILPRIAQRMDDPGRSIELRLERDPVLTEALRLLGKANNPEDLFLLFELSHEQQQDL